MASRECAVTLLSTIGICEGRLLTDEFPLIPRFMALHSTIA